MKPTKKSKQSIKSRNQSLGIKPRNQIKPIKKLNPPFKKKVGVRIFKNLSLKQNNPSTALPATKSTTPEQPLPVVLEEATDYIAALEMQV